MFLFLIVGSCAFLADWHTAYILLYAAETCPKVPTSAAAGGAAAAAASSAAGGAAAMDTSDDKPAAQ